MTAHPAGVRWIRAIYFVLGLIVAVGGVYLFSCGVGMISGQPSLAGVLNLLLGILLIQVASSLFRARRLLLPGSK